MEIKVLEVRDVATTMRVMAIRLADVTNDIATTEIIKIAGYAPALSNMILVINLGEPRVEYSAYSWRGSRTMRYAHEYIEENFNELKNGDVVDVEFILGETQEKKLPEWANI